MIETSPDISFFEAFARTVRESGLSQLEIARRANEKIEAMSVSENEYVSTEGKLLKLTGKLNRSTINRAMRAIDSISYATLYRIALGLDLDEVTWKRLEGLRERETPVNHASTTQSGLLRLSKHVSPSIPQDGTPEWIRARELNF